MSSAKLDEVLSAQKPSSDKTSLGYTILANSKSFVRPMFVTIVVFLDTFVLIALSCILKSKSPNSHRFPLKDLHLCLESY